MNTILKSLESGSQPYVVLRNLGLDSNELDSKLKGMLDRKEIIKVAVNGRCWFSLPKPSPEENPISPETKRAIVHLRKRPKDSGKERVCKTCGETKWSSEFPSNQGGTIRPHCHKCRYRMSREYRHRKLAGVTRDKIIAGYQERMDRLGRDNG